MKRLAVLLLAYLVSACDQAPKEPVFQEQILAFGTLIEVTLYDTDATTAAEVFEELQAKYLRWHSEWHAWEPGALTAVNEKLAAGETAAPGDELLDLLETANRLSVKSGGLFNPVAGQLINLWGFQGNPLPDGELPETADIAAWLIDKPDVDDIVIENNTIRSANPRAAYDLGGIAKGYAIDRCIEYIKSRGIEHAIINAGGDLRGIGRRGERAWRIGIRHPRENALLAGIELDGDDSVFTSGDYERNFEQDGKRYSHIIDPRSGYPANTGSASVTVMHESATVADAAATAIFIAGVKDWQQVAERMGVDRVMLVDEAGNISMTPAMRRAVTLPDTGIEESSPEIRETGKTDNDNAERGSDP